MGATRRQALTGEDLGLAGERVVARALKRAGMQLLGARLATQDAELDLVMLDGPHLVAVEVKTGRSQLAPKAFEAGAAWRPGHRFALADLSRVKRAAARIAERLGRPARVDLVELVLFEGATRIYHHLDIEAPLPRPQRSAFGRVTAP